MFERKQFHVVWVVLTLFFVMAVVGGCGGEKKTEAPKYPTKPIQMIIPWPAGGASDLAARLIASHAEKKIGQPISPINKDGANGATGWAEAVSAKPDGYTVTLITFDILTNQALGRSPVKYTDFDYLLQFTSQPMAIAVRADSPYKTLDDLIKAAKATPSTLRVSTTPLGGIYHQAWAMLQKQSGTKFRVVPFPGSAEVNTALLGKHVDVQINTLTLLDQYVKNGSIRILGVTSEKRSSIFPDVPTMKELNYNIVYESFRAIGVPKNIPPAVKKTLTDAFTAAFNSKEFQEAAKKAKYDSYYRNPDDFMQFVNKLYPDVQEILKDLGLKK